VVHIAMSIGVDDGPPAAAPGGALSTAADYYRRPERDTRQYRQRNVDRTREVAAAVLKTTSAAVVRRSLRGDDQHAQPPRPGSDRPHLWRRIHDVG
jgi:hypothetical protein